MKRALALTVSALSLTTAGLIVPATAAQAKGRDYWVCMQGYFCLGDYKAMSLHGATWSTGHLGKGCIKSLPKKIDNKASSMDNGSRWKVRLYDKKNCAGAYGYEAKPYSKDKDLQYNKFGVNMNDRVSSIKS
ncbi:peptidase inhibitor family I36 protein [Actinoallomurus sp. NPDC050550]|uniref:peptidase inhibitor family I36 protein n=1 Tax=unclassified Actinoallomurus TaxID=2624323 RepID=UPI0033C4A224